MTSLSNEQIINYFETNFSGCYTLTSGNSDLLNFEVQTNQLYKIVSHLFHDEELGFQFLTDICGIHYPDQTDKEIGVIYHLHSMKNNARIRLKVFVPIAKPDVPTLTGLYGSARRNC